MGRRMAAVVLLSLLIVGCSDPEQDSVAPPQVTESASEATPDDQALEVYQSMWSVLVEESVQEDPDYSELEIYASGDALELVRHGLVAEEDEGVVARGEPTFSPEVIASDESRVEIEDCLDSTEWLREDAETGDLVEPSPEAPVLRRVDATVVNDQLSWTVHELRIWDSGTCDG